MSILKATLMPFIALFCCGPVCFSDECVPISGGAPPAAQGVDNTKMVAALAKVERALHGVQTRAAQDGKLKPLARARIEHDRYPGTNGGGIRIDAKTDDWIALATQGVPMRFSGRIEVEVTYTAQPPEWEPSAGLCHGRVMWKTDDPSVSVTLGWVTCDSKAPERLLKIVREELQNQGIRMVPAKSVWPAATLAEHLSRLPSPDTNTAIAGESVASPRPPMNQRQPPNTPRPVEAGGGAEKNFVTPLDVVTAYRRACATKDWRTCFLCLTPDARGATLREFYFVAGMGNSPELVKIIEKHVKVRFFEDAARGLGSKEMDEVLKPAIKQVNGRQELDNTLLYQSLTNRINDVPAFVDKCCQRCALFADFGAVNEVKMEGDKAAGYWTRTFAPPDPREPGGLSPEAYLPEYYPFHFRRIGGSWLLADAPLHQ
jgi:hypothetical protein